MNFSVSLSKWSKILFTATFCFVTALSCVGGKNADISKWKTWNASFKKTASGDVYCHLETKTDKKNSYLIFPSYQVWNRKKIKVKLTYRSNVGISRMHRGIWIYANFKGIRKAAGIFLDKSENWRTVEKVLSVPPGARDVRMQLRIQQCPGMLDVKDVFVQLDGKVKTDSRSQQACLQKIASFKLENGFLVSGGVKLKALSGSENKLPMAFALPKTYCADPSLVYKVKMSFTPGASFRKNTRPQTLFAEGQNIAGAPKANSVTFSILGTKMLIGRISSNENIKDEIRLSNIQFEQGKTYNAEINFSCGFMVINFNGHDAGKAALNGKFSLPPGREIIIGGETRTGSAFRGKINAFEISVFRKVFAVNFGNGGWNGLFYGKAPHTQRIIVDIRDKELAKKLKINFSISGMNGKAVVSGHSLSKFKDGVYTVQLPVLPYGWYESHFDISAGPYHTSKVKSFVIMPGLPERVSADKSAFGLINVSELSPDGYNPELISKFFKYARLAGARWFRVWLKWDDVQMEDKSYNWTGLDYIVNESEKYDIELYITLLGGIRPFQKSMGRPKYRLIPRCVAPPLGLWQDYLTRLAKRYKGRIKYYQIHNEADTRCSYYPFSPESYAKLLKVSAKALRKVDPDVVIGLGGFCVAFDGDNCLRSSHKPMDNAWGAAEFYKYCPEKDFDILDVHFYSRSFPGQNWEPNMDSIREKTLPYLKKIKENHKPVWDTEVSFTSSKNPLAFGNVSYVISEELQAIRLIQLYVQSASVGIQKTFWYMITGDLGICNTDFTPKPSFAAYVSSVRELSNAVFKKYRKAGDLRLFSFYKSNSMLHVLWTAGARKLIAFKCIGKASFKDMWGNSFSPDKIGNEYILDLNESPVFVSLNGMPEVTEVVSIAIPAFIAENSPFGLKVKLRNPASKETIFTIYVKAGKKPIKRTIKLEPFSVKETVIKVDKPTKIFDMEVLAKGGIEYEFSRRIRPNIKKSLSLKNHAVIKINNAGQVKVGKEVRDNQNRIVMASAWNGVNDLQAEMTLARKGKLVNFTIEVKDNVISPGVPAGHAVHEGDAVELFFDFTPGNKKNKKLGHILIGADGTVRKRGKLPSEFNAEAGKTSNGYKVTGSFKLPVLKNNCFGFDLAIDDGDDSHGRKTQMYWAGSYRNRPEDFGIVFLNDTAGFR
jgi:hypothetical protein